MFRRREPVPFAFIAEAEKFRSNITPPPRARVSRSQALARGLIALTVVAGFAGSLLFGLPALSPEQSTQHVHRSEAADNR